MAYRGWRLAGWLALVSAITFTAGCQKPKKQPPPPIPKTKHAPATPIDTKRAETGGPMWNPAWDKIVEDALPESMLSRRVPRDVQHFCPRFYSMSKPDQRAFWAYFFSGARRCRGWTETACTGPACRACSRCNRPRDGSRRPQPVPATHL